jgi:glycosyltransferase involved in cell wall biosynthesis
MNLGGPAHHVTLLHLRLDRTRFNSLLVTGTLGRGEVSNMSEASPHVISHLTPHVHPLNDLRALLAMRRIVRSFRPDIVHTHTAKAGLVGRLAAVLAIRPRPILVHTFHGHVLDGYFGPTQTAIYRLIERMLGRITDRLVGVSSATVNDLVRLGVAPRSKFEVVPVGLELNEFLDEDYDARARLRESLGVSDVEVLVTFVGRLVPIKRVDLLVEGVEVALAEGAPVRLAIVGDGDLRVSLESMVASRGLGSSIRFLGYRRDMGAVTAATDIAVLASDNEGTPVFLIESAAAARPAVATAVGGVADVVRPDTGILVPPGDARALGLAIHALALDPERRERLGRQARERVRRRYETRRLVNDIESLYDGLIRRAPE